MAALEGPGSLEGCVMGFSRCGCEHPCPLHGAWSHVKAQMSLSMTQATIQELQRLTAGDHPAGPQR